MPPDAARAVSAPTPMPHLRAAADDVPFARWLERNVAPHQNPALRAVTLSFKRPGARRPAMPSADAARHRRRPGRPLQRRRGARHARPEPAAALGACERPARALAGGHAPAGFASANIGLLTDMIACPGGDFCALANARSIPIADAITERYQDLDELRRHRRASTCTSAAASTPAATTTAATSASSASTRTARSGTRSRSAAPTAARCSGPAAARQGGRPVVLGRRSARRDRGRARHLPRRARQASETFIDTLRRIGIDPFKAAANAARHATSQAETA